jgi:serine/threonine-protein kinase RsbT
MHNVVSEIRVRVRIVDDSDVVVARRWTRELASQERLSQVAAEALAIAVTEIARNIVVHAGEGEIVFHSVIDGPRRGIVVTARDTGPGILCIEKAMQDGFSTKDGLGLGLAGAQRLVDDFEIESNVGTGTTVTLRKWVSPQDEPTKKAT